MLLTFYALFADDIKLATTHTEADFGFDIATIFAFSVFCPLLHGVFRAKLQTSELASLQSAPCRSRAAVMTRGVDLQDFLNFVDKLLYRSKLYVLATFSNNSLYGIMLKRS